MFKSILDKHSINTCEKIMDEITERLKDVNKLMEYYTSCKTTIINYEDELEYKEMKCLKEVMTLRVKF